MDDDLVASGRYARLDIPRPDATTPRQSVTVGFVEVADGGILVAATAPDARWARSLADGGRARVTIGGRTFEVIATELAPSDPERSVAIRELILRYGTPSEGLGRGPVLRLERIAADTG